jgi:hypothetical protein
MSFSISRGGDWIDEQVAKSTGLPREHVTSSKEREAHLTNTVSVGSPDGALNVYYDALISYVIEHVKRKLSTITPPNVAFPVAIAGGSSLPKGFFELFKKKMDGASLGIEISKVVRAKDPLNSVARGCLIAAKTFEDKNPGKATAAQQKTKQQSKTATKKK